MWWDFAAFCGIMVLGQLTPGPDWVVMTRGALVGGFRSAVWTATGIACGLMVHAALAVGGLAVYMRKSEEIWGGLRWLAALYLLWIAFQMVRAGRLPEQEEAGWDARRPFIRGLLCNLLNPKVCLFLASVCAYYVQGERPPAWPVVLWGAIVIQGWLVWVAWAAMLQVKSVRSAYGRVRRWVDAGFAVALLWLSVRLMAGG